MQDKIKKLAAKTKIIQLPDILRIFLKDEAIGGKLILIAAVLALLIANSPLGQVYESFWHQDLQVGINEFTVGLDLRHWVGEGLMALFFLVVGLEIKREIIKGQLARLRSAILPVGAAVGGMIIPALIFILINRGQPDSISGWAVPIATDIAFALAVISLLGRRVSSTIKAFLLTLAIADDIGAILIIGLFYGEGFKATPLLIAAIIAAGLYVLGKKHFMSTAVFGFIGVIFWLAMLHSGVHAAIAGAFLGFLAPISKGIRAYSVAERLEKLVLPVSTFVVLPLFAFANLGVVLSTDSFAAAGSTQLMWGIILGLVLGKVLGIGLTSWILVRLGLTELPPATSWMQIIGVGFIAGIGFTVSVFIAELAFAGHPLLADAAKLAILIASTISAILGYLFLRYRSRIKEVLETELT